MTGHMIRTTLIVLAMGLAAPPAASGERLPPNLPSKRAPFPGLQRPLGEICWEEREYVGGVLTFVWPWRCELLQPVRRHRIGRLAARTACAQTGCKGRSGVVGRNG